MKRLFWIVPLLVLLGGSAAWWTLSHRPAPSPAPATAPTATASSASKLPGRTYLTAEQINQAMQSGDLDRPVKSLIAIDQPLRHGEFKWRDEGVPAGETWVRVDLKSQVLSVFRAGHEIGTAVILYGAQSKQTPPGTYPILAKLRQHRSSIYDADMPFTLRLTGDGIAVHASNVRWGAATHGCIGVPPLFAEKLFDSVKVKDDVVVLNRRSGAGDAATS